MARGVHPKKEVRKAIKELRAAGWTIEVAAGGHSHRWGTAICPNLHPEGLGGLSRCVRAIRSTPRNEGDHAKYLRHAIKECRSKDRHDPNEGSR